MHNIDMRHSIDTTTIALATNRATELGLSQSSLARALGVSQSQVSRIFSGQTSPSSKLAFDLCNYVFQSANGVSRESVANNNELMDALAVTWDGSPSHASALAAIIRSVGLLRPSIVTDRSEA